MIASRIRKAGNSYVLTIPPREMKARGLHEGQMVGFEPVPVELRPVAPPRLDPEEESDTSGDVPHEQVMRELEARMAADLAAGVVTEAELARARAEIEQGAPWTRSL